MHEMQGPHVAGQRADLPIPRLANALPGPPPVLAVHARCPVPRVPHNPWGRPRGRLRSGGEGISTASADRRARAFVNLFKNLSPSTECGLLSPHHGPYPPDIHSDMHKLGVTGPESCNALFWPNHRPRTAGSAVDGSR